MSHLLDVQGLSVTYVTEEGVVQAVDDVSFFVDSGEVLCLVGESGSGKSVTCMTLMGLTRAPNARFRGQAHYRGTDLLQATERTLQKIRGNDIALIPQDPMSALNPVQRIGDQIVEQIRAHDRVSESAARDRNGRADDSGRDPEGKGAVPVVCPRVLRRYAPEGHDRHGAVLLAATDRRRRAHHGAGRDRASSDPERAGRALPGDWRLASSCYPRLRGRSRNGGPCNCDVLRAGWWRKHPLLSSSKIRSTRTRGGCWDRSPAADRPRAERLPMIAGSAPSPLRPPTGCHFSPRCPHRVPALRRSAAARGPGAWSAGAPRPVLVGGWPTSVRLRMVDGAVGLATPEDARSSPVVSTETPQSKSDNGQFVTAAGRWTT